jgi:hypothetical protein
MAQKYESLRFNQMVDIIGGTLWFFVWVVRLSINESDTVRYVRWVFTMLWLTFWIISFESWLRFGECTYSMMKSYSGKFGVGCKHIWSEKRGNFILAFYPVERQAFNRAMESDSNKMPFNYFGERGVQGVGRAANKMMGIGPTRMFDELMINVWFNAPMNV